MRFGDFKRKIASFNHLVNGRAAANPASLCNANLFRPFFCFLFVLRLDKNVMFFENVTTQRYALTSAGSIVSKTECPPRIVLEPARLPAGYFAGTVARTVAPLVVDSLLAVARLRRDCEEVERRKRES